MARQHVAYDHSRLGAIAEKASKSTKLKGVDVACKYVQEVIQKSLSTGALRHPNIREWRQYMLSRTTQTAEGSHCLFHGALPVSAYPSTRWRADQPTRSGHRPTRTWRARSWGCPKLFPYRQVKIQIWPQGVLSYCKLKLASSSGTCFARMSKATVGCVTAGVS